MILHHFIINSSILLMKRSYTESELKISNEPKKIVIFGEGSIGKSTLFDRIVKLHDSDYRFPKTYKATDNFNFNRIKFNTKTIPITIDLWDTAGQESRGGTMRDAYLKGADGVLLLYDVSEVKTKDNIPKWLEQIKRVAPKVPVAVIGNKADKLDTLQQRESVKIRDVTLISTIGHRQIKNFLISIKENTHVDYTSSLFSSSTTEKINEGCMVGLEYVLSNIFNQNIVIQE